EGIARAQGEGLFGVCNRLLAALDPNSATQRFLKPFGSPQNAPALDVVRIKINVIEQTGDNHARGRTNHAGSDDDGGRCRSPHEPPHAVTVLLVATPNPS